MQIRNAVWSDVHEIVRMIEEIRGRSRYSGICPPVDEHLAKETIFGALLAADKGHVKFLVADDDGELQGMFVGVVKRMYECTDVPVASSIMWHVREGTSPLISARLAKAFVDWAERADGKVVIRLNLTDAIFEPEAAASLLERTLGFRRAGIIMEKETD